MREIEVFRKQYGLFNEAFGQINMKYEKDIITRQRALIKYEMLLEEISFFIDYYANKTKNLDHIMTEVKTILCLKNNIYNRMEQIKGYYQHIEL